jgi:hypothetical protein
VCGFVNINSVKENENANIVVAVHAVYEAPVEKLKLSNMNHGKQKCKHGR